MKTYLGDAVYLEFIDGRAVLTTENGLRATNTIFLEPEVGFALMKELQAWLKPSRGLEQP
jgi:hypothetical protein